MALLNGQTCILRGLLALSVCLGFSFVAGGQETSHHRHAHSRDATHRDAKKTKKAPKGPPPITPPVRDPDHTFQLRVRDWVELKRRNIVMQQRDYSCGAAALATVGKYYWGDNVSEDLFLRSLDSILTDEEIVDRIENGLAMSDLRKAAVDVGYQAVIGKTTFTKLTESKVPVIVGISPQGHDHFVVYRGTDGMWVYVADPIRGNVRMPIREFTKQWQENAILVIAKPGAKVKTTSPLNVSWEEKQLGKTNNQLIRTQAQREPAMPKPSLSR
jgi:predicted double-glycine peptidase